MFEFRLSFNMSRLTGGPEIGRRIIYASVTIGRRTYWFMRWNTRRCDNQQAKGEVFAYSRDRLMCYAKGAR